MQLKSQVEWALHCCAVLAGLPAGGHLATKALADFHGVPKEYLSKALQALSQAGLVVGTLGPTGGYRLARSPEAITFLDVVEAVEGTQSTFVCTNIRDNNPCLSERPSSDCDRKACGVARVMWRADQAWRDSLSQTRLSDLLVTIEAEVDPELRARSADWVLARA
jgi:Rrf2 family protein